MKNSRLKISLSQSLFVPIVVTLLVVGILISVDAKWSALISLVVGGVVTIIWCHYTIRPVNEILQLLRKMESLVGDPIAPENAFAKTPSTIQEYAAMRYSLGRIAERLNSHSRHLKNVARRDLDTGLMNRHGLIASADWQDEQPVLLLLVGLHAMELLNATLGPRTEQQVLRSVAERLQAICPSEAKIARGTGSELLVVQTGLSHDQAEQLIERIRECFTHPFELESDSLVVQAHFGVVRCQCLGRELGVTAIGQASLALNKARQLGLGQRADFDRALFVLESSRAQLSRELKSAIEQKELILFFQPIINLKTRELAGLEALVRWPHKLRGLVAPSEFIAMAEESGMIVELGDFVLFRACEEISNAIQLVRLPEDFSLHVNVSVRQLMQKDFPDKVAEALARSGLAPKSLTIEVTESLLMGKDPTIWRTIEVLKMLGVRLALDDFGTGQSSLAYLSKLPFGCLKIDRSFMLAAENGHRSRTMLRAITHVVHSLNVATVAEGIETIEQLRFAHSLGIDYAQGYLLGRPAPLMQALSTKADILSNKDEPETQMMPSQLDDDDS